VPKPKKKSREKVSKQSRLDRDAESHAALIEEKLRELNPIFESVKLPQLSLLKVKTPRQFADSFGNWCRKLINVHAKVIITVLFEVYLYLNLKKFKTLTPSLITFLTCTLKNIGHGVSEQHSRGGCVG
jgi:hypothetical protein